MTEGRLSGGACQGGLQQSLRRSTFGWQAGWCNSTSAHVSEKKLSEEKRKELDEAAKKFERTLGDGKGGK